MRINEVYIPFFQCEKPYAILMGGAGSGKSVSGHQKLLLRVTTETPHRFLVVRKVRSTIRESCFQLFKNLISSYGLSYRFDIWKSEYKFVDRYNGNEIICVGLDDPEKIKSVANITGILIEEMTELTEADFNQLDLRLRDESPNYKQIIGCFNPISKKHWIKSRFFDSIENDVFTLVTTYKDNAFLPREYIRKLLEQISKNEVMRQVYVEGKWGDVNTGDTFYKNFKWTKQVKKVQYNSDLPIHITFDFNVNPYVTLLISQVVGDTVYFLKEICLPHPENRTKHACQRFTVMFPICAGLIVYGDPAGKHQDTRSEAEFNDYTVIFDELKRYNPSFRVAEKAPPVKKRGEFIDAIFGANYEGLNIVIDESCEKLIDDLTYLKDAPDGTKLKKRITDKERGISYEEYGHTSDAMEYLICEVFKAQFDKFMSGGLLPEKPIFGQQIKKYY